MTNFDFLKKEKKFSAFADTAVTAETLFRIDIPSCVFNIRRATEFAVKWMYSVDGSLVMPYQDTLVTLINTVEFKDIVGNDLYRRLNFIRMVGNNSAHSSKTITPEQAQLALENLFYFLDFVAYCYADEYEEQKFSADLLKQEQTAPAPVQPELDIDIQKLIAENKSLKEELTKKREEQAQTYVPKPLDISEYKTRKVYIDTMLIDAGWKLGSDWYNEYELPGMPNKSEVGKASALIPIALPIIGNNTIIAISKRNVADIA